MNRRVRHRQKAFITIEVAVALMVLGLLTAMTAQLIATYRNTLDHYAMRQVAVWAADAQLQRVLMGAPIDSQPPAGMISDRVKLETRMEPGTGEWAGCDCVTVLARVERKGKSPIVETVSAYVVREVKP
jgi:type II secretory pathway pseudopilin PulG